MGRLISMELIKRRKFQINTRVSVTDLVKSIATGAELDSSRAYHSKKTEITDSHRRDSSGKQKFFSTGQMRSFTSTMEGKSLP